jgi:hypothetical protein
LKSLKKLNLPHVNVPKISGPREFVKKLRKKEADARALEPRRLRVVTFSTTFAAMAVGLSFIPLFPQPLPVLLAFMVAAVTYGYPEAGMPIGCGVVGVGLIYQLSALNFVAMLSGDPFVKGGFVAGWLYLFIVPPILFHRQKEALAIDLGILSAVCMFFGQTFFLAVPLILMAGVLFKSRAALTVLYSALIFAPLLLMQYLQTILTVTRTDWWLDPTAVPAIFAPLTGILKSIQNTSMLQFRLYDTNKIVTAIVDQIYGSPPYSPLNLYDVLKQYRDSLPGIMLFIAIVAALVAAVFIILKTLTGSSMEKVLPVITATIAAGVFFMCLNGLQVPLAISGKVDAGTVAGGILATVVLTLPTALLTYQPKKRATDEMLLAKANELMARLKVFEGNLLAVKDGIPVDVANVEGRMLIIKDKLEDVLAKAASRYYDSYESDKKFDELDKQMSVEIEALFTDLDTILREYHTLVNCEFTSWIGRVNAAGLKIEPSVKVAFQRELPIEERIAAIKGVIAAGKALGETAIPMVEQVYGIVRQLYDPNLPEKSGAVAFAREKLGEKTAPWVAIDSLLVALNNWRRQYSGAIVRSAELLQASLAYVTRLMSAETMLSSALEGEDYEKIVADVEAAEGIRISIQENSMNVTEVTMVGSVFETALGITKEVLTILNNEMLAKEKAIESMLPKKNYMWEKNYTLKERMAQAVEAVSNPEKYTYKEVLQNLPRYLSDLDECVATVVAYSERKELMLNYPTALSAIENQLVSGNHVAARDLPFDERHAEEFLKIFYSHKYPAFSLDEEKMVLERKPED